ncbi:MAG: 3-dehydroquinate synthase, partial [Actinomycetota bacterium]
MRSILITQGEQTASEILIGRFLGADVASLLTANDERRRVAVLTQPPVRHVAGDVERSLASGGYEASMIVLPDGEGAKTLL